MAKSFALNRDARRWLDEQTANVARGTYVDLGAGRITFAEFYADWSERQVWAPGTVLAMKLAANSVPFADVPLRSLRRSHVEGWVKGTVNRGPPRHGAHPDERRPRRAARRRRGQARPERPERRGGTPPPPSSAGRDDPAHGGWMFTGEGDQPPHQNTVGHRWRTATTAAGVPGLRLHDLRHFYASGLIASGCHVVTVQRALGRSSATTTVSTYSTCGRAPKTARAPPRRRCSPSPTDRRPTGALLEIADQSSARPPVLLRRGARRL